ncbi:hypothetical protein CYLTODRAFT_425359, partial [Cylindrobasidium torrendii FP15055 ss-10]
VNVDGEIEILKAAIKEHGEAGADGKYAAKYGVLFEKTANTRTSFLSTSRSVTFDGEILMHPKDKDVYVTLLE